MDRGERRRRTEVFIKWTRKSYAQICGKKWFLEWYLGQRVVLDTGWVRSVPKQYFLGSKKQHRWECRHCSKRTHGRPKAGGVGACGYGMDRSSRVRRNRWRLKLGEWK